MDKIKIRVVSGLLDDGTTWHQLPIRPETDVAFEKTAKNNGWGSLTDSILTAQTFFSFHTAKAAGFHDLTWDEFLKRVVHVDLDEAELDPTKLTKPAPTSAFGPFGPKEVGTAPSSEFGPKEVGIEPLSP